MNRRPLALALVLATALAGIPLACTAVAEPLPAPDPAPVVAAERAFAANALALGWVKAFRRHAAPEGITFGPGPVNAQANLATLPDDPGQGPPLTWWPVHAGLSRSGELGYTTGPFAIGDKGFGFYFTVWAKQPDSSWKWIFDAGPRTREKSPQGPDTEPTTLPAPVGAARSAEAALAAVTAREAELAVAALSDTAAAYRAALAADARIMGSGAQPATDPAAHVSELATRATPMRFETLGGRGAEAGDLVFTYGRATWTAAGGVERQGHYARIWQHRTDGWRLVLDELIPMPPPKG